MSKYTHEIYPTDRVIEEALASAQVFMPNEQYEVLRTAIEQASKKLDEYILHIDSYRNTIAFVDNLHAEREEGHKRNMRRMCKLLNERKAHNA